MKKSILSLVFVFVAQTSWAQYSNYQNSNEQMNIEPANQSTFSKNRKYDGEGIELYESNLDLKAHRKFGIGASVGGANGLVALSGEINVEPKEAAFAGLGFGPSYSSFNLGWKHNFEGYYINPYTKVGYSKWFNSASGAGNAGSSDVLKQVLSDEEIRTNRFGVDFVVGSIGLEYNQLEGNLAGMNLVGELNLMTEISNPKLIPTGSIGIIYYY